MDGERKLRSTRNLQVSYKETGRNSKSTKTKTFSTGTLAYTSPINKETTKSSSKSVNPPVVAGKRLSNQVNPPAVAGKRLSTNSQEPRSNPPAVAGKRVSNQVNPPAVAGKRLSTTSQEPRSNLANPTVVAGKRVSNRVNPPAVAGKRLSTSSEESRFTAIEAVHNQLKAENVALHHTAAQLKADLESVQFVLVEFCDTESKLREYQEINQHLSDENSFLKQTISALRSETNTLQQEVTRFRTEIKQIYNQHLQYKDGQASAEKGVTNEQQELTNELKLEVAELNRQIQQFTEAQSLVEKGITLEQQEINTNIVIRGVDLSEITTQSDLLSLYNNIRSHLGIANINEFAAVSARILQPNNRPSSNAKGKTAEIVQVQLSTVAAKRQFLQISRAKKDIVPADIGLIQKSKLPVLITEQLTRGNQELLFFARSLRGTHRYKYVWSCNGQILVRLKERSKVIRIRDIEHVNQLRTEIQLQPLARNGRLQSRSFIEPGSGNTQA